MKTIDVKEQPNLGINRTVEICINGIRYRLFRSAVTVVVITVAIAFMMNIMCEALSMQAVARSAKERTAQQRQAALWTARLSVAGTPEEILRQMAGISAGEPLLQEAEQMGGLSDSEMTSYCAGAREAVSYLILFNDLDYGRRRLLVGSAMGIDIFDTLQDQAKAQAFTSSLAKVKSVRLPGTVEQFQAFLKQWPTLKAQTLAIQHGHQQAIAEVTVALHGQPILDALCDVDGQFGEIIAQAGFSAFDTATRKVVAEQARELQEIRVVEKTLEQPAVRSFLAAELNVLPGDINPERLWTLLHSRKSADWFLTKLAGVKVDPGKLTAKRLVALAQAKDTESSLARALHLTTEAKGGFLGMGTRMTWLVLISLLVCVVGISNAMLMTVTERFREIATLKCLGALDNFIMLLFVIEACILGMVGGLIGSLVGSLIGFGRMFGAFGGMVFSAFPGGSWCIALGLAIVVGIVLAAVAGVYPSYIAARLAPMEAMRIE